jgi:hypothetical protein
MEKEGYSNRLHADNKQPQRPAGSVGAGPCRMVCRRISIGPSGHAVRDALLTIGNCNGW